MIDENPELQALGEGWHDALHHGGSVHASVSPVNSAGTL